MKRLLTVLGILVVVGVIAIPVLADGPGWGRGGHMMGYGGRGHGDGGQYGMGYGGMTRDQRSQSDQFGGRFYNETADLRNGIRTKTAELGALLNSSDPDTEKAKALQKEISDLRAKMDDKRLSYELEARKTNPDARSGRGYGMGYGRGRGGYGSDNYGN